MPALATQESRMYPQPVQEACAYLREIARANEALQRDIGFALDRLRRDRDSTKILECLTIFGRNDAEVANWKQAVALYVTTPN